MLLFLTKPLSTSIAVPGVTNRHFLLVVFVCFLSDGAHGCARGHSEDHLQRGEARKAAGAHPALLQGGREVPAGYAEER